MSATLRPARPADLDALCALEEASFSGDRLSRRRLRHWITADNALLLVAIPAGRHPAGPPLLGYILTLWRRNSRRARLYSLAIAPEARGRGLARALLASTLRRLKRHDLDGCFLEVARGNSAAIGLYRSLGFEEFGSYPAYYEDGQDALRMRRTF